MLKNVFCKQILPKNQNIYQCYLQVSVDNYFKFKIMPVETDVVQI